MKKKKKTKKINNLYTSIATSMKNDKLKSAFGLIVIATSIFLAIAFLSFFYSGYADRSKLDVSAWDYLSNPDILVTNFAGKLGALSADLFINDWFGIASVSVVL